MRVWELFYDVLNTDYPVYGMHDLTGFQRDLLYVIAGLNTPHGLAIHPF